MLCIDPNPAARRGGGASQTPVLARFAEPARCRAGRWDRVLTSRQITDAYLLALAVARKGHLVTFDRGISVDAVPGAAKNNLTTLN